MSGPGLKYSERQRTAVAVAVVDRDTTAPAVVEAAKAGSLHPDLKPFEIALSTVRDIAAAERQRRDGRAVRALLDEDEVAAERGVRRIQAMLDVDLAELARRQQAGELVAEHLRPVIRAQDDVLKTVQRLQQTGTRTAPPDDGDQGVDEARQELEERLTTAPSTQPPDTTNGGGHHRLTRRHQPTVVDAG